MTIYDYVAIAALILTIGVNTASVYLQKTRQLYTKKFGQRANMVHGVIISFFWALFIYTEFVMARSTWRLSRNYPLPGLVIMLVAFTMFALALKQIGYRALGNGNFFGHKLRTLGGVYNYISNPIYWSYCVWFAGLGLVTGQKGFFLLAIIAAIGLIGIEARVESPK